MNKDIKLSEHCTLGEMTKTSYHPLDGNIPSRVHIENLINLCVNWLEDLRYRYNLLYVQRMVTREGQSLCVTGEPHRDQQWLSLAGGESEMWRSEELEPSDGLCGGYQM